MFFLQVGPHVRYGQFMHGDQMGDKVVLILRRVRAKRALELRAHAALPLHVLPERRPVFVRVPTLRTLVGAVYNEKKPVRGCYQSRNNNNKYLVAFVTLPFDT